MPEEVTKNVLKSLGIEGSGASALEAAMDPFHDFVINHQGWPDTYNGASVVQCIKRAINISSPTPGSAYDFAVHITPSTIYHPLILNSGGTVTGDIDAIGYETTGATGIAYGVGGTVINYGGTMVCRNTSVGNGTLPISTGCVTDCYTPFTDTPNSSLSTRDAFRVVGCGFELVNTTAALYKSGRIMTYRQDDPREQANVSVYKLNDGVVAPFSGSTRSIIMRQPPATQSAADILPGSLVWEASDGAYVTGILANIEQEPRRPYPINMLLLLENTSLSSSSWYVTAAPTATAVTDSRYPCVSQGFHDSNLTPCGAIVEGLTAESTFTLTIKWYIETFPSYGSTLIPLAVPSAPFDPHTLAVYARAARLMPTGCVLADNAKGDWWRRSLSAVASVANTVSRISKLVPDQRAQKLSEITGVVGKISGDLSKNKPSKKAVKKAAVKEAQRIMENGGFAKAFAKK